MSQVDQAAQDPNANMEKIAAQREAIWQAHHDRMKDIESAYQSSSVQLQLSYGEQIASSMSAIFKQQGDEQNKFYKATITAEKSFAIIRSMIAIKAGIAQAANNPWPLNLAAMATVAAETASIVSSIKDINVEGFATGGFTGIGGKFDPAGIVHKGEVVWSQEDIKRWGGVSVVEAMRTSQPPKGYSDGGLVTPKDTYRVGIGTVDATNSGKNFSEKSTVVQPVINIHTLPGQTADVSMNADGSLDVRIRKVAGEYLNGQLSNPNSDFSKGMKRSFNVTTKRG
jgi:hypothetical protein